jgi:hypothetical protein
MSQPIGAHFKQILIEELHMSDTVMQYHKYLCHLIGDADSIIPEALG